MHSFKKLIFTYYIIIKYLIEMRAGIQCRFKNKMHANYVLRLIQYGIKSYYSKYAYKDINKSDMLVKYYTKHCINFVLSLKQRYIIILL